jgi:hypothetical protein
MVKPQNCSPSLTLKISVMLSNLQCKFESGNGGWLLLCSGSGISFRVENEGWHGWGPVWWSEWNSKWKRLAFVWVTNVSPWVFHISVTNQHLSELSNWVAIKDRTCVWFHTYRPPGRECIDSSKMVYQTDTSDSQYLKRIQNSVYYFTLKSYSTVLKLATHRRLVITEVGNNWLSMWCFLLTFA